MDYTEYSGILTDWYESDAGKKLYRYEAAQLEKLLPNCFGYNLVQLGGAANLQWLNSSPIKHFTLANTYPLATANTVLAHPAFLPFAPDSLDVVLLPHTLECTLNPEMIIDEACSALLPGGFLIILGINQWSLWGAQHHYQLLKNKAALFPWVQHSLPMHRLEELLHSNQMVIDYVQMGCYQPYSNTSDLVNGRSLWDIVGALAWSAFGSIYVILARKEISGLIPVWDKNTGITDLYEAKIGLAQQRNSKK